MNPRRYRGSAPVRFRAWVPPVVGGLLGGALIQYAGAIAMMPADFLCNVSSCVHLEGMEWMCFPAPDPPPDTYARLPSMPGRRSMSVHSGPCCLRGEGSSPDARMWYRVPSLMERVARSVSPEVAADVKWPRIELRYRQRAEAEVRGERFTVWSHHWGL